MMQIFAVLFCALYREFWHLVGAAQTNLPFAYSTQRFVQQISKHRHLFCITLETSPLSIIQSANCTFFYLCTCCLSAYAEQKKQSLSADALKTLWKCTQHCKAGHRRVDLLMLEGRNFPCKVYSLFFFTIKPLLSINIPIKYFCSVTIVLVYIGLPCVTLH